MIAVIPTVDVEGVHGKNPYEQLVMGNIGSLEDWGVFRIARIFRNYGIVGTFFVDVYEHTLWGEGPVRKTCERLLEMDQDVQLHTHPSWRDDFHDFRQLRQLKQKRSFLPQQYDLMAKLAKEKQIEVLEHGIGLFERWLGIKPIAHRSGGYSINAATVAALRATGIPVDSSMNVSHPNSKLVWSKNSVVLKEGVLEIPITVMEHRLTLPLGRYSRLKKTSLDSCGLADFRSYIDAAEAIGLTMINFFMHSYSLMDYDRFYRKIEPDKRKAQRLEAVVKEFLQNRATTLYSCQSFHNCYREDGKGLGRVDAIPVVKDNGRRFVKRGLRFMWDLAWDIQTRLRYRARY